MRTAVLCLLSVVAMVCFLHAQDLTAGGSNMDMSGMGAISESQMGMESHSLIQTIMQHASSGTDAEPSSTPSEMVMFKKGDWMFMFHGEVFLNVLQQTGPRGADKLFSTNWFMPMAQRKFGTTGTLTLRTMLSLEP